MSDSVNIIQREGAYEHPFSGRGIEFAPLGTKRDQSGLTLHETGFDPQNSDWNFPSVLSPFWRIYYNIKEAHCVVFGDRFYPLGPKHLMLIPDHQSFHCLGQHPTPSFWLHFSYDRKPARDQSIPLLLKPDKTERELIQSISGLVDSGRSPDRQRIYHLSQALLNLIISRPDIRWSPPLPDRVLKLITFIEDNSHEKIPNTMLAHEAGISVEGVYRLFRTHLGTSPADYTNRIRIRKASHLLKYRDCSIDEIAELTGFPNRAYFSRVFKKVTGQSPGAFRAQ